MKNNNSDEFLQINKKQYWANWFPPNSAAFILKDVYYHEMFIIYQNKRLISFKTVCRFRHV